MATVVVCTRYARVHSKVTVTTAIITIPRIKAKNCLIDSFGSSSFRRSGRTVTKAICRNVPAVNGKIHEVLASKINHKNIYSPIEHTTQKLTNWTWGSATSNSNKRADESSTSGNNLKFGSIPPGESRFEEYSKIAHFVWNFMHQNRECC